MTNQELIQKDENISQMCQSMIKAGKLGGLTNTIIKASGKCKTTFYEYLGKYPEFARAFELARLESSVYHENILVELELGNIKGNVKASEMSLKTLSEDVYGNIQDTKKIQIESSNKSLEDLNKAIDAKLKELNGQ